MGTRGQALIESYWSIGQRIAKEKLNTRAQYHNAILGDLSSDLSIDLRTLQRTVTFYQQLALTDALSVKRLTIAIQSNHYQSALDQPKGKPLQLPRPRDPSYLYKAEVRDVIDADTLLLDIDLGFEVIRRRYVAHVFYAFNRRGIEHTFLKGRYLNQELVWAVL